MKIDELNYQFNVTKQFISNSCAITITRWSAIALLNEVFLCRQYFYVSYQVI